MKTFEEFMSKAKGAVDALGEKAGQFASVSKLNLKILDMKSQLKNELSSLGEIVYKNHEKDDEIKSEIAPKIQVIKELYENIDKTKTQIAFMKNKVLCKNCGSHNEIGSAYCAKCGENLKNENANQSEKEAEETDDFSEFED